MRVGPFTLRVPIGRGGSGAVWAARHVRSGVDVAVKVLTAEAAREPHFVQGFHDEARIVAGLDHLGIVWVLDAGTVEEGFADVVAGSPWLAMELGRDTLRSVAGQLGWPALRGVLEGLLDALAHAHARGVVHLDLKPANVLIGCDDAARSASPRTLAPGLRIADFSVSRARGHVPLTAGGTPLYMAPEQVQGDTLGPATDLYSLGSLAWALACGQPPFYRSPRPLGAQVHMTPPAFRPRIDVPAGLEAWLRRLLEKRPSDRYPSAAAARVALRAIGAAVPTPELDADEAAPLEDEHSAQPTMWPGPLVGSGPTQSGESRGYPSSAEGFPRASGDRQGPRESPESRGRIPVAEEEPPTQSGASRGYPGSAEGFPRASGERQGPRAAETLVPGWEEEEGVPPPVASGASRASANPASTDGPPWLAPAPPSPGGGTPTVVLPTAPPSPPLPETSAVTTEAEHRPWRPAPQAPRAAPTPPWRPWVDEPAPARPHLLIDAGLGLFFVRSTPMVGRVEERTALWDALGRVVATRSTHVVTVAGARGAGRTCLVQWLAARADEEGLAQSALGRSVSAAVDELAARAGIERADADAPGRDAALAAVRRTIRAAAGVDGRVVVLAIDADADPEAEELARTLLIEEVEEPCAVLLVLTTPSPTAAPGKRRQTVSLGPLPDADIYTLVRALLPLTPELEVHLVARARNSPADAVLLLAEQVRQGRLVPGPDGFDLAEGAELALPGATVDLWRARIATVCGAPVSPPSDRHSLVCAAALGAGFALDQWSAAAGHDVSALARRCVDAGLGRLELGPTPRLHFASGLVRDVLEADARADGTWATACRAAFEAVPAADLARRGRLLLGAGEPDRAWRLCLAGARALRTDGDTVHAWEALQVAITADAALPPDARRAAELGVEGAWGAHARGHWRELEPRLATLRPQVAAWDDLASDVDFMTARTLQTMGRIEESAPYAVSARDRAPDAYRRGFATLALGSGSRMAGDLDTADRLTVEALAIAGNEPALLPLRLATLRERALIAEWRGDLVTSEELAREGVAAAGRPNASAVAIVAALLLARGAFDEARAEYGRAIEIARATGVLSGMGAMYNGLGELARRQRRWDDAERMYRHADAWCRSTGISNSFTLVNLGLVALARERPADAQAPAAEALAQSGSGTPPWVAAHMVLLVVAVELGDRAAFVAHADALAAITGVRHTELRALASRARDGVAAHGAPWADHLPVAESIATHFGAP